MIKKDPQSNLDYGVDWSLWMNSGDTISVSSWSVSPSSMALTSGGISSHTAIVFVGSGGSAGNTHTLTNRITTSQGRIDERSIVIQLNDR